RTAHAAGGVPVLLRGSRSRGRSLPPGLCSSEAVFWKVASATAVVQARHAGCSSAAAGGVEAGHEFTVGGACGVEVLGAFLELQADVDDLLFEGDDALVELVD